MNERSPWPPHLMGLPGLCSSCECLAATGSQWKPALSAGPVKRCVLYGASESKWAETDWATTKINKDLVYAVIIQ